MNVNAELKVRARMYAYLLLQMYLEGNGITRIGQYVCHDGTRSVIYFILLNNKGSVPMTTIRGGNLRKFVDSYVE
jgi:hypothetical protein